MITPRGMAASRPRELDVHVTLNPEAAHVRLSGVAYFGEAAELEPRLLPVLAARRPLTVINLSGLTGISSLMLGTFVRLHQEARRRGLELVFTAPPPTVLSAIRAAGLDKLLKLVQA